MSPTQRPQAFRFAPSALALLLSATVPLSHAASFTWDTANTPGTPVAGTGTWDTATANWSDGATDSVWANVTNGNDAVITGSSTITAGTISVHNITNTGTTTISGGTITLASAASTNTGSGNPGPVLIGGTSLTISSIITGTRGLGVGGGTVTLSGANTYTGNTLISNGTLRLGANNALTAGTTLITFGSGRIFELNGFNQTVAGIVGSNGFVQNTATGFSTLTLNGTTSQVSGQTISGKINLVKQGSYTQTLSAGQSGATSLSYTGTTTISAGGIRLSNANSHFTGTTAITIDGGALVGGITGNLNLGLGDVVMSSGSITPGDFTTAEQIATFTLAATKDFLATGGTLNFSLGLGNTADQIIGSGAGSAFSLTGATTLNLSGETSIAGSYNLFSGFASGNVSGLTITGLGAGFTGSLNNLGVLTVSASPVPEPSTYALLGGLAALGLVVVRRRLRGVR